METLLTIVTANGGGRAVWLPLVEAWIVAARIAEEGGIVYSHGTVR